MSVHTAGAMRFVERRLGILHTMREAVDIGCEEYVRLTRSIAEVAACREAMLSDGFMESREHVVIGALVALARWHRAEGTDITPSGLMVALGFEPFEEDTVDYDAWIEAVIADGEHDQTTTV